MTNILLVEDEPAIADTLRYTLEQNGLQCLWASTISEAHSLLSQSIDLCILDIGLPDGSGLDLCKEIRQQSDLPILFLTARQDEIDRIIGLEIGGDDYVGKPFSPREVCARVKAILRRTQRTESAPKVKKLFDIGKLNFDYDRRVLRGNESYEQKLTSKEADLLKLLCENTNDVLERSVALNKIWKDDSYFNARSMDVYITKLRKYLRADPKLEIVNMHGRGFKLLTS